MKFIITVDTEADNQWQGAGDITLKNIASWPRFQLLCEQYQFLPTYLITYEITQNQEAVELLRSWQDSGRAEIGAHLHPWTSPPFTSADKYQRYPSELSDKELGAKLEALTGAITEQFGRSPTSYRAGRWGFDGRQVGRLRRLGYFVDCSVTPKVSWRSQLGLPFGSGGPDFRRAPVRPYYLSPEDICSPGAGGLLELPMTILSVAPWVKEGAAMEKRIMSQSKSLLKKFLVKLYLQKKWLRIFPASGSEDWPKIYQAACRNNLPVLQFMIHSSELALGASPDSKNQAALDHIYGQLGAMFAYFREQGLEGMGLSAYAQAVMAGKTT